MNEDINNLCEQILRQLVTPMERRNDSNLLVIQSQVESIKDKDSNYDEKILICKQLLRQLNIPMRRSDDWNLGIVKEKVKALVQKLEEENSK